MYFKRTILLVYFKRIIELVFANGLEDRCSIPGRVISKTQTLVLDVALLCPQHYEVRIKGKVEQSREWSGALPIHHSVVAIEIETFGSPLTKVAKFITLHKRTTEFVKFKRICWLRGVRPAPNMIDLGMTLNCIWWWNFSSVALESMEYFFSVIWFLGCLGFMAYQPL